MIPWLNNKTFEGILFFISSKKKLKKTYLIWSPTLWSNITSNVKRDPNKVNYVLFIHHLTVLKYWGYFNCLDPLIVFNDLFFIVLLSGDYTFRTKPICCGGYFCLMSLFGFILAWWSRWVVKYFLFPLSSSILWVVLVRH